MNTSTTLERSGTFDQRQLAQITGLGLLLIIVFVGLAEGVGFANILVDDDAAATAQNILEKGGQLRFGILAHLMVIAFDLLVAWSLYLYLKRSAPQLALFAGWLRLAYSILYAAALFNVVEAIQYASAAGLLAESVSGIWQAQAMLALGAFRDGWNLAFVLFGFHLGVLGWALLKDQTMPKWLAWLIVAGGFAYLFDFKEDGVIITVNEYFLDYLNVSAFLALHPLLVA